jgi:hypothetical protein
MNLMEWFRRESRLTELTDEIQSHIGEKTDLLEARGDVARRGRAGSAPGFWRCHTSEGSGE